MRSAFWRLAWSALLLNFAMPSGAIRAQFFAGEITKEMPHRHRVGGPDAIAGIGDWALANGVVCSAISNPRNESMLSDRGGVLIDLGHCGRDDDQWVVLQPMLNLSRENTVPADSIRSEVSGQRASIITRGRRHGVLVETRYSLAPPPSNRLVIETHIEREAEGEAIFLFGEVAIHGNGQLSPFTLSAIREGQSAGFNHPEINLDDAFSMADAMSRSDLQILVGGNGLEPGISYGWRWLDGRIERMDGSVEELAQLALCGEHFSILGSYADTLFYGGHDEPNLLELAQSFFMDIDIGERVVFRREIMLARRSEVASVTDQIWHEGPLVRGRVDAEDLAIGIETEDGSPITHLRTGPLGFFSFRMPPDASGNYRLRIRGAASDPVDRSFSITRGRRSVNLGEIAVSQPGRLELPQGTAMRLVFEGVPPTATPRFGADLRNFRVGEHHVRAHTESDSISLAGVASDPQSVDLAAGRYRVLATRGPLWSVQQAEFSIVEGETLKLAIEAPRKLLSHPGWLSVDLHVHAAPSDDSSFPLEQRIASFVAQGADVIVSTEHDNVVDYAPLIQRLGLQKQIKSLVGVEITSTYIGDETPHTAGHANAFPLLPQPGAYRGGAPPSQNLRLRAMADHLAGLPLDPLLQLNHPRAPGLDSDLGSYFSHLSVSGSPYDPTRPLDHEINFPLVERSGKSGRRDIDFDAIELLNGPSMEIYRLIRADWFSFMLQGEVRTATANSDSHRANEIIALPRNYVAYSGDPTKALESELLFEALRQGRSFGSTGPLLAIGLGGKGPGERFSGSSGRLEISVQVADWIPVHEVRVFMNAALHSRREISGSSTLEVPMAFETDSFVTVEVEGRAEDGSIYARLAPSFTPFAFSNAILVDADADGHWRAPGLPSPLPATLTTPTTSP